MVQTIFDRDGLDFKISRIFAYNTYSKRLKIYLFLSSYRNYRQHPTHPSFPRPFTPVPETGSLSIAQIGGSPSGAGTCRWR